MNQTIYEDRCSRCKQTVTRLRRGDLPRLYPAVEQEASGKFVTSCCSAPPMAVKRGT